MTARATWKGTLKIALVQIPIKVFPATDPRDGLTFNQLHEPCQTRVTQRKWCTTCGREVPSAEIVKGFEFEKGKYVLLLEAELDAVQPPSTRVIDLVQVAEAEALDPIHIAKSYYLAPDGDRSAEAFAVLSAALVGKVGIGKLAIYGREYLVAVRVSPDRLPALMLHTLHHWGELRPVDMIDDLPTAPSEHVRLARQVLGRLESHLPLDLSAFTDAYHADVRRIIDAKIAGQEIIESAPIATSPVLPLREALTQSLQQKKVPAKATLTKKTRAS